MSKGQEGSSTKKFKKLRIWEYDRKLVNGCLKVIILPYLAFLLQSVLVLHGVNNILIPFFILTDESNLLHVNTFYSCPEWAIPWCDKLCTAWEGLS